MAVSQNGWRANTRSLIVSIKVPGGKLAVRKGSVAVIMQYIAEQFHNKVEPLKWPGNWGYAERPIRGGSSLSNHASGTAIDLNAPAHWLGAKGTFTASQVREIRKILSACGGTIRWGGDYRNRKDEMHFEINAGTAAVNRVAKKLQPKLEGPSIPGGGGSSNTYGDPKAKHKLGSRTLNLYDAGTDVRELQEIMKGLDRYHDGDVDAYYGPAFKEAIRLYQNSRGLDPDGIAGPDTIGALTSGAKKVQDDRAGLKKKPSAPKFPLPSGHWYGVESSNPKNHSGYYKKDQAGIKRWQKKMRDRGWTISVDGIFGPQSRKVARQFQAEKNLSVDGGVGRETWDATWEAPVT